VTGLPPWLVAGILDIGVEEIPGTDHAPRILEYHLNTGQWSNDEVPWCGSAVETWLVETGFEGLQRRGALARAWGGWGRPANLNELGAICVLRRRKGGPDASTGSRWGYHVGVYLNMSRRNVVMLSGNKDDRVGVDTYSRRQWERYAMRMPDNYI
jgi:uncharacterized protein (TIGR02594 family)